MHTTLRGRHKDLHPLLKIAEWLLIMMVSMAVVSGLWMLLPINHADTGALLLFQAMQAIGLFIAPALVVWWLWKTDRCADRRQTATLTEDRRQNLNGRLALLSVGIMLTAIPLINCLVAWNESIRLPESMAGIEQLMQQMEQQAEQVLERFMTYKDGVWWMLVVNLVVLAVLPGIGEEMAFRGVLQDAFGYRVAPTDRSSAPHANKFFGNPSALIKATDASALPTANTPLVCVGDPIQETKDKRQKTKDGRYHVAVWVTAFVFSFVHFQFYGFIPRLLMGALLGYAFAWSGRLGYSMIMHVTNNALSVIVFYLATYIWHLSQAEIDAIGTGQTWWLTVVCTPIMIALIYIFYKQSAVSNQQSGYQSVVKASMAVR